MPFKPSWAPPLYPFRFLVSRYNRNMEHCFYIYKDLPANLKAGKELNLIESQVQLSGIPTPLIRFESFCVFIRITDWSMGWPGFDFLF